MTETIWVIPTLFPFFFFLEVWCFCFLGGGGGGWTGMAKTYALSSPHAISNYLLPLKLVSPLHSNVVLVGQES